MRQFGELLVIGTLPEPLAAPLRLIGEKLHPTFDIHPIDAGQSRKSCVHSSLAVRDYLVACGLQAEAVPAALVISTTKDGKQDFMFSLGSDKHERPAPKWKGHMVVLCEGWLIDPTMSQFKKPEIPNLPDMIASPRKTGTALGLDVLSTATGNIAENHRFAIMWLHTPRNEGWRAWDSKPKRELRQSVVRALRREYAQQRGHGGPEHPRP